MLKQYNFGMIMRAYGEHYIKNRKPYIDQIKAIRSMRVCRTPALGGKQISCAKCGHTQYVYNSCGNRNCPICQSIKKELWIDKQLKKMLPVKHYHIVFTLPHELGELLLSNQRVCYNILFKSAWKTINSLCSLPKWMGAQTGMISMLHT